MSGDISIKIFYYIKAMDINILFEVVVVRWDKISIVIGLVLHMAYCCKLPLL